MAEIKVPTLGESVTEATVGKWFKQPGDAVAVDEPLVELETDKVTLEVPAPAAGVLGEIRAKTGETVGVAAVLGQIKEGAGAGPKSVAAGSPQGRPDIKTTSTTPINAAEEEPQLKKPAGAANTTQPPSVKKIAAESGVDPANVQGSGKHGQVLKGDMLAAIEKAASSPTPVGAQPSAQMRAPSPADDASREERVPMTRLRQTIARRLKDAQNSAAMLTTYNEVDMSAVMKMRADYKDLFEKKHGTKLGFMGFFTRACIQALKDIPAVNAQIDGEEIVYHDYLDVSVAVSAPKGLVVPVVRNADRMSFAEIEKTIADFGKRAKEGTLGIEEMQGGTFTISNGGVFGSLLSTPIINPPQSAVLGMHRIEERPIVKDGQIVAKPMMYLALSYDHRLIDGREAVTFLVCVKEAIQDPTRLLIDL